MRRENTSTLRQQCTNKQETLQTVMKLVTEPVDHQFHIDVALVEKHIESPKSGDYTKNCKEACMTEHPSSNLV
jgi:hypothetical protein